MKIETVTSFCHLCNSEHPLDIRSIDGKIVACLQCREGERSIQLSSDASLFLSIRNKARLCPVPARYEPGVSLLNHLYITNVCNFECPICFAASGQGNPFFMSPDAAFTLARKLKMAGGRTISVNGGEPSLHPDLFNIVRRLRKLGFYIDMYTNGLLLGQDSSFAAKLAKSGLSQVNLQFDTLRESTSLQMRGNTYIREKMQAANNCIAAGMRLGIITTVTRLNLHELEAIINWGLSFGPHLTLIVFTVAAPVGRFSLPRDIIVDREEIIRELLKTKMLEVFTAEDVLPLPNFGPWNLHVHPDCAVFLCSITGRDGLTPLRHIVDINALYEAMARYAGPSNVMTRVLLPLYYLVRHTKRGKRLYLLKRLIDSIVKKNRSTVKFIGVGSIGSACYQDEEHIKRCPTSVVCDDGFLSPCSYFIIRTPPVK